VSAVMTRSPVILNIVNDFRIDSALFSMINNKDYIDDVIKNKGLPVCIALDAIPVFS
jgi:hypothetical protein